MVSKSNGAWQQQQQQQQQNTALALRRAGDVLKQAKPIKSRPQLWYETQAFVCAANMIWFKSRRRRWRKENPSKPICVRPTERHMTQLPSVNKRLYVVQSMSKFTHHRVQSSCLLECTLWLVLNAYNFCRTAINYDVSTFYSTVAKTKRKTAERSRPDHIKHIKVMGGFYLNEPWKRIYLYCMKNNY